MEVHINTDSVFDTAVELSVVKQEPRFEDWKVEGQDDCDIDLFNGSLTNIKQEYKCLWCQDHIYTDLKLSSYNVKAGTVMVSCEPFGSHGSLCVTCHKIFNCHVLLKDVKNRLSCPLCSKYCITLKKLDKHKQSNCELKVCKNKKLFQCNVCLKSFTEKRNFNKHQQRPHKIANVCKKYFVCDICGYNSSFKQSLVRHLMRIHYKSKLPNPKLYRYKCEFCGNRYKRKDLLTAHTWNHTGYRPVSCEICGVKFKKNDALRNHLLTHTGERPFACDVCSQTFNRRSNMVKHRYGHYAPHEKCPYCHKLYKKVRHFDIHVAKCKIINYVSTN